MTREGNHGKPIFLLGVGAQKAGTSFLHDALNASPGVALSSPKELHVLDSYFRPELCPGHRRLRRAARDVLEEEAPGPGHASAAWKIRRALMLYDLGEYVRYFRERAEGKLLTGDITPSYSMLTEAHLCKVDALLSEYFNVRVIFLMRDPLERIYSAMRMQDREAGGGHMPAAARFSEGYGRRGQELRTRYEDIVPRLERSFGRSRVYFGFYETLFEESTFCDIGRFLGLRVAVSDLEKRVNASPREAEIPREAARKAREYYAATYEYCQRRFPDVDLQSLWPYMNTV